jgi:hypothetical protein
MTPTDPAPPPLSSAFWLWFSRDEDPVTAAARFVERFHEPPAWTLARPDGWWVGPLPDARAGLAGI